MPGKGSSTEVYSQPSPEALVKVQVCWCLEQGGANTASWNCCQLSFGSRDAKHESPFSCIRAACVLEMTWTYLFIYFCHFPDQSQSLLQKAKKLYLVEEQGLTGGWLVDKEPARTS